jgi:hypothetical protein
MSRQRVYLLGLGLMLSLGAATVLCQADEPKKDADKKDLSAEDTDRALEEIALAYRLADAGRKAGSPEALLGAAKILSKLNGKEIGLVKLEGVKPLTVKPGDKKKPKAGEPIKEDGGQPTSFAADIKKLKADARKLNNPRDEALAALIDKVNEDVRGSLGGPKWMGPFTLQPAGHDDYKSVSFRFRANQPARILVRNKSGSNLNLHIYATGAYDGANVSDVCEIDGTSDLEWKWRAKYVDGQGRDGDWLHFDVDVENRGDTAAEFELFKN